MKKLLIICWAVLAAFQVSSQTHEWVKQIRGFPTPVNNNVIINAMATDDQGNTYIGGAFKDTLYIESDTHVFRSNGTNRAIFLAKFKEDGSLIWSKSITTATSATLTDMEINSRGRIILYGTYTTSSANPNVNFGNSRLSSGRAVFVAFMTPNGNFTAARDLATASTFIGAIDFKIGPNDELFAYIYLNGFSAGGYTINSTVSPVTGTGFINVFCKFDSTGRRLEWYQGYDISDHIENGTMALEPNGNLLYSFRAGTQRSIHGVSTGNVTPIMLIRAAASNGNILKAEKTPIIGRRSTMLNMVCPKPNQIFVQGYHSGDSMEIGGKIVRSLNNASSIRPFYFQACLHDLDSAIWAQGSTASPWLFVGTSEMVYSNGFLYAGFQVDADSFSLGGLSLKKSGPSRSRRIQSLIAKFDTLGNTLWMLETPSSRSPFLAPIGRGNVVYYGGFSDTVRLPPFVLRKPGLNSWAFLAKTFDFTIQRGNVFSGPYCAGDSIVVPYTKTGDYDTANFFIAEISDEDGNFTGGERELGRIKSTEDSVITGTLPLLQVASSDRYRIRIRSTAPAVQSFFREDTLNLLIYSRDKADPGPDTSICIGDTMQLRTFGGTTWSWSPFVNMDDSTSRTPLIWPDSNTTYQIIIGDSSGCGAPDTAQLFVKLLNPPEIDTVHVSDSLACIGQHIQLSAFFSGGTGQYTAHWQDSSGNILRTAQSSLADTFQFEFKADTGFLLILTDSCSEIIDSARLVVRQTPNYLVVPDREDSSLCYGTELQLSVDPMFDPIDSLKVSWFQKNSPVSDSFSWSNTWFETDSVRYRLENTCTQEEVDTIFEVKVFDRPEVSIRQTGLPSFFCVGQSIPLVALPRGGNANYFYEWRVNGQLISKDSMYNLSVESIPGINLSENDSVQISLRLLDSCSSVDDRDSLLVFTRKSLQLNSWNIGDSIFCQGDSIEFAASAEGGNDMYNFSWSVNGTILSNDSIFNFVPSQIGSGISNIKLLLTDNCSYPDSLEKQIGIPDSLVGEIVLEDTLLLCMNEELLFNSFVEGGKSAQAEYTWLLEGSLLSDSSTTFYRASKTDPFLPITELLSLEIRDACSRYPIRDSVRVRIANRMVLSLKSDSSRSNQRLDTTLCYGQELLLQPAFYNTTNASQRMEWLLDGAQVSDQTSFTFGPTHYRNNESDYTLLAVGYDSCSGLIDTLTIDISLLDSLSINPIADTLICYGSSLSLTGTGNGGKSGDYEWQWRSVADNRLLSNSARFARTNITEPISFRLELTDGCSQESATESVFVSVIDPLSLTQLQDNWCFRDEQRLDVSPSGGVPSDYRFEWFVNGELFRSGDQSSLLISGDSIYRYQVVLKDACSSPSDTLRGVAAHVPEIAFVAPLDTACETYVHDLSPRDTSKTNSQFELYQNLELQSNTSGLSLNAGTYSFVLLAENEAACKDSARFDVFVRPLPDATFSYSPQQPTEDEPLVVFTARAQDLDSYLWTINGDNFGNESVAEYQFRDSGLYVIQLSVLQDGCESDSQADILFVRKFEFLGVNAFSPNNDGVNDLFIPNFTGVSDFTYVIYNRWGAKIFEGNRSTPWDGTYDSKPAMAGIYFVIIEAVEPDGRQYFLNQSLQLLR